MEIIFIYGLVDPRNEQIRYVGRTRYPSQRLWEHHQERRLKTNTHKNNWIRSLLSAGLKANMKILEECDETNWSERERFWISNLPNLTNTTDGGEGEHKRHKERKSIGGDVRRKISEKISAINRSESARPKYAKMAKTIQGKKKSPNRFCGVCQTASGRFLSYINYNGKRIYIGTFASEDDAAIAYDVKAREFYGNEAHFNFPERAGMDSLPSKTTDSFSSKYKGINRQNNKWVATAFIHGKKIYFGSFLTEQEAYEARCKGLLATI